LADEDRCWSIAHTTDYHRSTAAGWEIWQRLKGRTPQHKITGPPRIGSWDPNS
jgi:hypothetical protein